MRHAIYTSALTIIGGVLIYVIGQILMKFVIDPIHELKAHIGRITDSLIFYANVYGNPGSLSTDETRKASDELRRLASELMSKRSVIPWYRFWSCLRMVPRLSDIRCTRSNLVGLSNGVFRADDLMHNTKRVEEIKKALRLPKELLR